MSDILGPANAAFAVTTRPAETRTFGAQDTWFTDCTSPSAADGTDVAAAWLNQIVANLRALARANGATAGGAPVVGDNNIDALVLTSLQHMLQRGKARFGVDGGAANAADITLSPVPAEIFDGFGFRARMAYAPTGAATLRLNGNDAFKAPVKRRSGLLTIGGEWAPNDVVEFTYVAAQAAWQITGLTPSDTAGSTTTILKSLQIAGGRYATFTAGSDSWIVPDGVSTIRVLMNGGGGGGGGAFTGGSNLATGRGGGGGQYSEGSYTVVPGQVLAYVVGAGGVGGLGASTPTAGNAGGTTSLGGLISAGGGGGGGAGLNGVATGGGLGGTGGSGGLSQDGGSGGFGPLYGSNGAGGGAGGYSPRGGPSPPPNINNHGQPGNAPGGGGNGGGASQSVSGNGGGGSNGGTGGNGIVIIQY